MTEHKSKHNVHRAKPTEKAKDHSVKKSNKIPSKSLILYLTVAIVVILIITIVITVSISNQIDTAIADNKEKTRPAEISLTIITSDCEACFDINAIVNSIKSKNVKILDEKSIDLVDAQDLIEQYDISRLPTVIVTGEIDKHASLSSGLEKVQDALILTKVTPPYADAAGNIKGALDVILITEADCTECFDLTPGIAQLKDLGMYIESEKTYYRGNILADDLIAKYAIKILPTLIISKQGSEYPELLQIWQPTGTIESDGTFVSRTISPPYYDLADEQVVGIVDVTYLDDASCEECYDPLYHKPILERFGIAIGDETTIDTSSKLGQAYIEKYEITQVPTIIVSPDASKYTSLLQVWPQVGTTEDDGYLIFRTLSVLRGNKYMDLSTGKLMDSGVEVE